MRQINFLTWSLSIFTIVVSLSANASQKVWFAPNIASTDYLRLFTEPQSWEKARSQIQIFKFYQANATNENDPAVAGNDYNGMKNVGAFAKLRSWGLQTAVEVGVLKPWQDGCKGAKTAEYAKQTLQKVEAAGGRVDILSLDEPLHGGKIYCKLGAEESARELVSFIQSVRAVRPDIKISLIEPFPAFTAIELAQFLNTVSRLGGGLNEFHVDVDRHDAANRRVDVVGNLRNLAAHTRGLGLQFGVIFWSGYDPLPSDQAYYEKVMELSRDLKLSFGSEIENVVIQSWATRTGESRPALPNNLPTQGAPNFSHTKLISDVLAVLRGGGNNDGGSGQNGGVMPAGYFRINHEPAIYNSNGEGAFCAFETWDDFVTAGGNSANVRVVSGISPGMRNDGLCVVPMKAGFFRIGEQPSIYNSNGQGAYCGFANWNDFIRAGGDPHLRNVKVVEGIKRGMRNDGLCQVP